MKITQKTIAEALDISVQTVSLSLRKHPSIPQVTQQKVQDTAEAMGYRKNPLVSALMASRGRDLSQSGVTTLAYVTFCTHLKNQKPSVRKQIYVGVCSRAAELGFNVQEFCLAAPTLSSKQLHRILMARGIQAVILAPPSNNETSLTMDCSPFAIAALGNNLQSPAVHRVTSGIYDVFLSMMQELHSLGYRRPGLCINPNNDANLNWQWGSLFDYTSHHLFSLETPLVLHQPHLPDERTCLNWVQHAKPDVVISLFPELRTFVENSGLKFPDQMGYVSLYPIAREDEACMNIFGEQIGMAVVDMVTAHLYRNDRGIPAFQKNMQIKSAFVQGATLRQQP
ncbi:LacI family DNA-binding transcriptional regulator [Kiritimatiellota bacterium B12222]|nr:LacI family DNA-binding transcriptional regulator [Kiritimatiellota bacterium B12222]